MMKLPVRDEFELFLSKAEAPSMWLIPSLSLTILDSFQKWLIPSFSRYREEKKRPEWNRRNIYFPFFRERESPGFVFPNILEIANKRKNFGLFIKP